MAECAVPNRLAQLPEPPAGASGRPGALDGQLRAEMGETLVDGAQHLGEVVRSPAPREIADHRRQIWEPRPHAQPVRVVLIACEHRAPAVPEGGGTERASRAALGRIL